MPRDCLKCLCFRKKRTYSGLQVDLVGNNIFETANLNLRKVKVLFIICAEYVGAVVVT